MAEDGCRTGLRNRTRLWHDKWSPIEVMLWLVYNRAYALEQANIPKRTSPCLSNRKAARFSNVEAGGSVAESRRLD